MTKILKNYTHSLILIILFSTCADAEPALLWKKSFDSRIIKTSRLADFTVENGKKPNFPLRAVMTTKSIYVIDAKGKLEKKISLQEYARVSMSDQGTVFAGLKGKEIAISGIDGQMKGVIHVKDPQPVIPAERLAFELAPDGTYLVILSQFNNTQ